MSLHTRLSCIQNAIDRFQALLGLHISIGRLGLPRRTFENSGRAVYCDVERLGCFEQYTQALNERNDRCLLKTELMVIEDERRKG